MGNHNYDEGEEEAAEAQNRIDQILGGGAGSAPQQGQPDTYQDDPLGGAPRVELRSRAARSSLGVDQQEQQPQQRMSRSGPRQPARGAQQAIMIIGGIVVLGIIVVGIIILLAGMSNPGAGGISLPFISTATPTPTSTATPTSTPTPTATVPPLNLPNLTCLVTSATGCLDYCQNIDNLQECDQARNAVETQGGDFTVFLKCLQPAAGANTGNPQTCLEEAYRAKHP